MPYASKPNDVENATYYLTKTEEYVKALVMLTENDVSLGGSCITMDRLYTAVPTSEWLLEKDITMVDTLNHNRIGLPNELKTKEGRENLSSKTFWKKKDGKLVLTSYVTSTKSSGMKNIPVLSTVQPLLAVTKDDGKRKPSIIKLYDFTKIGTDIVDQRNAKITTKAKSSR